jgi:hypothetical protein
MNLWFSMDHLARDAPYICSADSHDDILMEIVPCIAISYVLLTFDYIALYICCECDDQQCNLIMAHNTLNMCLLVGCTWVCSYYPMDKCVAF